MSNSAASIDPGWRPSLRIFWWRLIPFVGVLMTIRPDRSEQNQLVDLRTTFLRLVIVLFLFLIAFTFIAPWDGGDETWFPLAVVGVGVMSLVGVTWVRRRPLATASSSALAGSYRETFYMGVGIAESSALLGALGMFVSGSRWLYVVGMAFGLAGLSMAAPTRHDIERHQRDITAGGSPLSLVDALASVPPSGSRRTD